MLYVFGFLHNLLAFPFYEEFHFHRHFRQTSCKRSFQFFFSEKKIEIKKAMYIF